MNVNMKNVKKEKLATVTLTLYTKTIMIPETIIHELNEHGLFQ